MGRPFNVGGQPVQLSMRTTINGIPFEVEPEPADYWGWIREGRYDHEWQVYDALLAKQHTFVDCGAWVGAHSLYASTLAGRVIAVEPDPVAFAICEKNLSGMDVRRLAISDREGEIKLGSGWLGASTTRANPNAGGGIGAWDASQTCQAPCTTIRKFCQDLPDPLFIKIDIEGSEEGLFKDAAFFAERKPTMLIELHPFWWIEEAKTWADFRAIKDLYSTPREIPHRNSNTWLLAND